MSRLFREMQRLGSQTKSSIEFWGDTGLLDGLNGPVRNRISEHYDQAAGMVRSGRYAGNVNIDEMCLPFVRMLYICIDGGFDVQGAMDAFHSITHLMRWPPTYAGHEARREWLHDFVKTFAGPSAVNQTSSPHEEV